MKVTTEKINSWMDPEFKEKVTITQKKIVAEIRRYGIISVFREFTNNAFAMFFGGFIVFYIIVFLAQLLPASITEWLNLLIAVGIVVYFFGVFFIFPYRAFAKYRKWIRQIKNGDYKIIEDTITKKCSKNIDDSVQWIDPAYEGEDALYLMETERCGEFTVLGSTWNKCTIGSIVYGLFCEEDDRPWNCYPSEQYLLDDELMRHIKAE